MCSFKHTWLGLERCSSIKNTDWSLGAGLAWFPALIESQQLSLLPQSLCVLWALHTHDIVMHASKMSTHVKIFKKKINTTAEKISNCNYYNSVFILVRKFAVLAKQVLYHNNVFKLSSHFTIEPHSRHRLQQDSCSLISGNIVSLLKGAAWGGGGTTHYPAFLASIPHPELKRQCHISSTKLFSH